MPTSIKIRSAKAADLPRVLAITKLAYKVPYKEDSWTSAVHESKDVVLQAFSKKEFFCFVTVADEKNIAAIRYTFPEEKQAYFYRLAVLKTFRKHGLGAKLIAAVEKAAKKKGCETVTLECMKEKKLPAYYALLGYATYRTKKHHDIYICRRRYNFAVYLACHF